MKKLNKLFAILFALLGVQTLSAQIEYISNGDNLNLQYNFGSPSNHAIPEIWTSDARQGYNFSQSVELPNGVYKLEFQMMYRASKEVGTSTNCVLYAETSGSVYNASIKNFGDETGTTESLGGVTSAMNNGLYMNTLPYFIVTNGKAIVGARSLGALTYCTNGYWLIYNPSSFKLTNVVDDATLTQALSDVKAEAQTILDAAADSEAKNTLQNAYDAATATADGIVSLKKAIRAYLPNTGTAANPVDVSSLILSADFSQKAFIVATKNNNSGVSLPELQPVGWTCTDTGNGQYNFFNVVANNTTYDGQSNFAYNGKTTGQSLYMRHAWGNANLVAKQTVKFPNGRYKISIPAKKTGNTATVKYTFAGITETHNVTTSWAVYEKTFTVNDINNELTIELTYSHPSGGGNRAYFDGVTLLCYGDPIKALLEEISTKASELRGYETKVPQTAYNGYSECLTAAENANNSMEETALQTILDNLNVAINDAVSLVTSYANVQALININESILNNSEEFEDGAKKIFSTDVSTAKTDVEGTTTSEAINAIYSKLETARQTYVKKADPTNGTYFDYTFLVTNPGFDNDKEGWTSTGGAQNKAIATNKTNGIITGKFYENWNGSAFTGEIYQTVSNLPSGIYKLKIAAFGAGTNVYANDKLTAVTTSDGAWYEVDQVKVGDGTLKFGVKNENATTWMGIDNASLEYYGFDVATAQFAITSMVTEAEGLVGKPMNADVASALQAVIDGADATKTTRNELNSMIETLSKAIANAEASVADYAAIKTYIDKANKIDESIAANYKSEYDNRTLSGPAAEVFKALELATYTYVKDEFSYPVELEANGWIPEGPTAPMSGQHFDGTNSSSYLEQSSAAWGWDAWSISYKHDKTLPAGDYVFKVAGRRASGIGNTMSLVVTNINDPDNVVELGLVNDFPEGDTGLGINTKGETSFDANDEAGFANNGAGRGWQWRYVKFTLSSETTVRIAVTAEATTKYQWVGFCNATLQMTEETYLAANMSALDAPMAAAQALVDSKPMGTAENEALKDALALPVTKGAELLAKIDALNAAVANANAWIPKYNAAKAPLVAALERFEADYNDAGNGASSKMSNSAWANILDKVKAAALAKDVTNSYEGFADATEALNTALDAAQASIDAYAALKTAIDAANTAANGANVGEQPFQRPESAQTALKDAIATAQTAYDKAEDDATGVKTTLDSAVETFNNAELNKPKADEAFNIVLVYANYEFDGKAMTYIANDRKDHGLYNIKYKAEPNANYAQAFTLTPITDKVNHYTLSMTDVDGNERYVCTGTVYGGNASQIRTTTDASKALAVKVIATSTDGIWNLYNTEAKQYIGSQDEGVFTVNSHIDFNIVEAEKAKVTLSISDAGWATLILPFNAGIPDGVTVYASESVEGELVKLTEVGSIVANTPYLIKGTKGAYEFSGYGLADEDSYKDAKGLFVGTFVDYKTEGGEYVLQNHDRKVAFYRVGDSAKPTVKAYRCYLIAPANGIKAFFFGDEVTGINGVDTADAEIEAIYTINGTRVNNLQKGLNIVKMSNGKTQKVYVK